MDFCCEDCERHPVRLQGTLFFCASSALSLIPGSEFNPDISILLQLLKRKTAEVLFNTLHIERWAFDVEMLKVSVVI